MMFSPSHKKNILLKAHYRDQSFVSANVQSFNHFVDHELPLLVKELGDIVPTIIPPEMKDFRIKFDKVWITKPSIIEADGSKRNVLPVEARLRNLSYSAPIFMEISTHIDGTQRESFTTQIGKLPVM